MKLSKALSGKTLSKLINGLHKCPASKALLCEAIKAIGGEVVAKA